MNVKEPLVHDHGEVPNQTMGHCVEICTRKTAGEARSILDSVLTEESGSPERTMQCPAFCIFFLWVKQNVDSIA